MSRGLTWACHEIETKKEKLGIGFWKFGIGIGRFEMGFWKDCLGVLEVGNGVLGG
ncbi:MAG: hypothetical protein WC135_01110 [Bacteroidales bacterium]